MIVEVFSKDGKTVSVYTTTDGVLIREHGNTQAKVFLSCSCDDVAGIVKDALYLYYGITSKNSIMKGWEQDEDWVLVAILEAR